MVHTHSDEDHVLDIPEPSVGRGQAPRALPHGAASHPLVSLGRLLAT
jgi:hypothetical protein